MVYGNSKETSLWFDHWLDIGPLFMQKGVQIDSYQIELKVADLIDSSRNWDLSVLKNPLRKAISMRIYGYP